MKNTSTISLIACSMVFLLNGCAQKGTISLYGPEAKSLGFNTYFQTKQLKNCNDIVLGSMNGGSQDDFVIDRRWSNSTTHEVPVNLDVKNYENSNVSTTVSLEMDKLRDGQETVVSACLTKRGDIQLYVESRDVKVKPLVKLESEHLTCSDEIQVNYDQKSVLCKSIHN